VPPNAADTEGRWRREGRGAGRFPQRARARCSSWRVRRHPDAMCAIFDTYPWEGGGKAVRRHGVDNEFDPHTTTNDGEEKIRMRQFKIKTPVLLSVHPMR